jgi:hypothetical protein|tara:strand:- start:900 stop:1139 length:240 start_codon:yes stop_codon:yes gene_type:complete
VPDDLGVAPKLHEPSCTGGECDHEGCLKKRLQQLRACKTEFADSGPLIRYKKYAKMPRTRNDGSEYTEASPAPRAPPHS